MKKAHTIDQTVIYQIYPRSYCDANGDGIGDLRGIISKLDYINGQPNSLGVNTIWISPFYNSPMRDFGYDISDFCNVDPIFGTLDDFKELLTEAHQRNIKVIIDFVPNHSSDQHPWFEQSRSSKSNPKRDWYVWKDPTQDGGAPNNWYSIFGGSAWTFDEQTGQYYLHSFLKDQPDLNWDNPDVRQAMMQAMRFWLDLGVDGFRVDAIPHIAKDPQFRNDPSGVVMDDSLDYDNPRHIRSRDGPKLFDYVAHMAELLREYPGSYMVSEAYPTDHRRFDYYYQYFEKRRDGVIYPFVFGVGLPWKAQEYRELVDGTTKRSQEGQLPVFSISNHDNSRIVSRIGKAEARVAAMMLLTIPGIPSIYYGDEIGMVDVRISKSRRQDPGQNAEKGTTRDSERTPMQWDDSRYGGFSNSKPWLPSGKNKRLSVEYELTDDRSMLNLYRKLLRLRTENTVLTHGDYKSIELDKNVYAYTRSIGEESLTILLNFSKKKVKIPASFSSGKILISTYADENHRQHPLFLRPNEGIVLVPNK